MSSCNNRNDNSPADQSSPVFSRFYSNISTKGRCFAVRKSKVIAVILVAVMAVQTFAVTSFAKTLTELDSSVPFVAVYKAGSYGEYLQNYARASASDDVIHFDLTAYTDASENVRVENYEGKENVLITQEEGYVEFTVEVPSTGLYGLGTTYYPIKGRGVDIERSITINGETPYTEAKTASLDRIFADDVDPEKVSQPDENGIKTGYFVEDVNGNQIRPSSLEVQQWVENAYFKDSTGSFDGALQFYLEKGTNVIRLTSSREPVAMADLYLYGVESSVSYTEFLAENNEYMQEGDQLIAKIQAEYPSAKSSTSVYSAYDRSSAATEPQSSGLLKYNVLGGDNWNTAGQWVEYKVNVPETGLYKIVLRARQNIVSGTFSSRQITVNGETPVSEATRVRFAYSTSWEMKTPADDFGTELLFKFNKGENTVRFTATTGELSQYINAVDTVVSKLNNDYRKIMQITGSSPDKYRDYKLDEEIPDVISDLKAQGDILMNIYNNLIDILGGEGQQTAIIFNAVDVLYDMADDPDEIPSYFSNFKNQITNLGSWLTTMRNQPLELDYFLIAQPDYNAGDAKAGIFSTIWHNVDMFFTSFKTDTNAIGATSDKTFDTTISIWATTGKERAEIKQRLIERAFVNQYEIGVDIKLVPGGALLPSVFAGKGPDIVMGLGCADVVNYASRNALVPLNNFEGFETVKTWFSPSAFVPISIEVYADETKTTIVENTYGLPEKQSFDVLYYREDVLNDLGMEVPSNWDQVYEMIAVLKKRYMDFAPPAFLTLLYQQGESLYKNHGYQINLDSETAIQAFITQTDYYITYNCPKSYDFQNRFRFGEMPIGISPLEFYNTLCVAAPEIRGNWTFTTIPGTVLKDENGNPILDENGEQIVNYSTPTTVTSICLLMKGVQTGNTEEERKEYADACWTWMKWWVSEDAQYEYGIELEASLGIAARYNTANKAAAQRLPWTTKELVAIMDQWDNTVGYEEEIGGYYYSRYYSFAFNEVLDSYADARESLLNYVQEINEEIKYKRDQLNLPYSDAPTESTESGAASN